MQIRLRILLIASAVFLLTPLAGCKTTGNGSQVAEADSGLQVGKYKVYKGGCTPDYRMCGFMAPTEMPIFAINKAFDEYIEKMKALPQNQRGNERNKVRVATYNMNVDWYASYYLKELVKLGVKVDFYVDFKLSFTSNSAWRNFVDWVRAENIDRNLVQLYQIPVMRGRNPQMHNKIIILGEEAVMFGSANWTYSGLVGNYENVMLINGIDHVVQNFVAEIDELGTYAKAACEQFAEGDCGRGVKRQSGWAEEFVAVATKGKFRTEDVDLNRDECRFLKWGLMSEQNIPRAGVTLPSERGQALQIDYDILKGCFADARIGEKFANLARIMVENERYSDGTKVMDNPPIKAAGSSYTVNHDPTFNMPPQHRKIRTYFSPEDNVEWQLIKELQKLYYKRIKDPETGNITYAKETYTDDRGRERSRFVWDRTRAKNSFAYVSTNFITNRSLARHLSNFSEAGGHVRVFFDRGRWVDPIFSFGKEALEPLEQAGNMVIFDNQLSGAYGCNHNKMAVLYVGEGARESGLSEEDEKYYQGMRLLNGSANWSIGAMKSNDENIVIAEDERIAMVYLREIFSQLYVYWFGQREDRFQAEIDTILNNDGYKINKECWRAMMTPQSTEACDTYLADRQGLPAGNVQWKPRAYSSYTVSVANVPADPVTEHVYAWYKVEGTDEWKAAEAFTYGTFSGRWVTSMPAWPGKKVEFKMFRKERFFPDPNPENINEVRDWEPGENRRLNIPTPNFSVHGVDSNVKWGQQ